MAFDVEGARRAGYSDGEIADYLAGETKFDAAGARRAGYSDTELVTHLTQMQAAAAPAEDKYATGNPMGDQGGQGGSSMPSSGLNPAAAVGRVGSAIAKGFTDPPFLTKEADAAAREQTGSTTLGKYVVQPLADLGSVPLRALNALGAGLGQTAYETGAAIDPRLGRDLYQLNQLLPELQRGTMIQAVRPDTRPPSPPARFVGEYYGEGSPANPLSPEPPPAFVPPGTTAYSREVPRAADAPPRPTAGDTLAPGTPRPTEPGTATGAMRPDFVPPIVQDAARAPARAAAAEVAMPAEHTQWITSTKADIDELVREHAAAGGPSDLGAAATPEQLTTMSPAMTKAYRRMAEVKQSVSPIEGMDNQTYVPGSVPTLAERMGDPRLSQEEVLLRQRKPEAYEGEGGRLTENNRARINHYDEMTLSDPQIETLRERQAAQAQADTALIERNAGPVNASGIAEALDQLLADPRIAEQPDVVKVLTPMRNALYNADGSLKTDFRAFWGMHDNLQNLLTKAKDPLQASSSEKFAVTQINAVKKAIDAALSDASNGAFGTFLENQQGFFQQLNAARILREFRDKKMVRRDGTIDPNAFHRFVTDLAVRRGKPGIDPSMDIPDATMQRLLAINDDLKRASRIDLGKARGSPTNLFYTLARGLGIGAAHSVAAAAGGGPTGSLLLQGAIDKGGAALGRIRLNRAVRRSLEEPPQNQMMD